MKYSQFRKFVSVNGSVAYTLVRMWWQKGNTYDSYESSIKSGSESLEDLKKSNCNKVTNYYYNYLSLWLKKRLNYKR